MIYKTFIFNFTPKIKSSYVNGVRLTQNNDTSIHKHGGCINIGLAYFALYTNKIFSLDD